MKRKYDDTLSEFEKLRESYHILEADKEALTLSVANIEGEKINLESKVLELEENLKVAKE